MWAENLLSAQIPGAERGGGFWGSSPECFFKSPESFGFVNSFVKNIVFQHILYRNI